MDFAGVRTDSGSIVIEGIAQGAVTAGKTVSVMISGTTIDCLADRDITIAAGDMVYGIRSRNRVIILGRLYPAAPDPPDDNQTPPPPPEPVTRYGKTVIAPVETRTRRLGWRVASDDTFQGDYTGEGLNTGCAFYGAKPRSLAGATVTKATVRVMRLVGRQFTGAEPITLWRVTEKTRPSGAPTLQAGSFAGPNVAQDATKTFTIPDSWGQGLVDGTVGGLAIYTTNASDYVRLAGRAAWAPAWTLTIEWKRVT